MVQEPGPVQENMEETGPKGKEKQVQEPGPVQENQEKTLNYTGQKV